MNTSRLEPRFLLPVLGLHLLIVGLAWRDISRRSPAQLRGSKTLWRAVTALNAGNVVVYLTAGCRR
jgi:hypothetical protein